METESAGPAARTDAPPQDRELLQRAVALGRRGWGRVHPNPMVGCVIVQDGEVVGEGWHREYGEAHAEVAALRAAGEKARDATVYVSLEPCRHEGKTPPCTGALLEAKVAKLVFGARDPHPESGGGAEELAAGGIRVDGPLLTEREARRENPAFFHREPERPWTALKLAISLDGRIASRPGVRTAISGEAAGWEVQRLRAGFDAILVGTETVLVDDPLLTVRGPVEPRVPPIRVVMDARGRMSKGARLLNEGTSPAWVLTGSESPAAWRAGIEAAGGRIVDVPEVEKDRLALDIAFRTLRQEGVRSLLCEGGGVLGGALLEAGLVDRLYLVVGGAFLGRGGVPAFPGSPPAEGRWVPAEPPRLLGDDLWVVFDREEG